MAGEETSQQPQTTGSTTATAGPLPEAEMGAEDLAQYSVYLINNEKIEQVYKLGLYTVLRTNRRVIFIGKVLKNIMAFDYKDIERIEYYTDLSWANGVVSLVLGALIYVLYTDAASIWGSFQPYIPGMLSFLNSISFMGLSRGLLFIIFIITIIFLNRLYIFIFSFMGKLRVLTYGRPALEIHVKLNADVQDIIKLIEEKKAKGGVNAKENTAKK